MTDASATRESSTGAAANSILVPVFLWSFLPYTAVSLFHVIVLALNSSLAAPSKLLLMPLLALPVLILGRGARVEAMALLLVAVVFSWLGDGAGAFFPSGPELPLMLAFFGLAHVAYIALFLRHLNRRRLPWWTLVYAAWWVAMIALLGPHTGSLFFGVAAYGLILAGTATLAARCSPTVAIGGAFFLASDTILAFRLFLPEAMPWWTSPAVMFTYTIGQGLIVAGVLLALRRGARSPRTRAATA